MAFRSQAVIALGVVFAAGLLGQPSEYTVHHDHLRKSGAGTLRIDESGIAFAESSKNGHSREWKFDDIQQLTLSKKTLRVLSYEDSRWKAGRDREWVFTLPKDTSTQIYSRLHDRLDQRFIAAMPEPGFVALYELPAKLTNGIAGSEGVLAVGRQAIVYSTKEGTDSRTWRLKDIDTVASSGPFDLTITTLERAGLLRGGPTDFHFQLKRPLSDERYQALWRTLHRAKGMEILQSYSGEPK